ncbi:prohibitin family protein [Kurthia sibirica]|uniref:Band 7 domain-containing protein n=1 Tax=Kurthia sibirica TaxID=202750 RepID=A0A2U3ANF8_9BACL|nr:prohibitin family protein [Kurthia sibirica]PWI26080.1 hypothetical protein DEX24_05080 [Kurthia sibirica]
MTAIGIILKTERIPAGEVGVVYNTKGIEDQVLSTGWHITGLLDKTIEYPVKLQTIKNNDIKVSTNDGKSIEMDFAYNFTIDPEKVSDLFNKFGAVDIDTITDNYLRTRLWEAARTTISTYNVIEIYGEKSSDASAKIQDTFSEDIRPLGFTVTDLTIGVPKADESIQNAIDERVKASQQLEKKKTDLAITKAEAERKRIEAEGQAKANRIISKSVTKDILTQQYLEKWDGKTPLVTGDANSMIQIPIDEAIQSNKTEK